MKDKATEYLNRATCKDVSRPTSIQAIARRANDRVATDGYRLHREIDLATTTPSLSNGEDFKIYPDVDVVIATLPPVRSVCYGKISKSQLKDLKALCMLDRARLLCEFIFKGENLIINSGTSLKNIEFEYEFLDFKCDGQARVVLDLRYFVDAILEAEKQFSIKFRGEGYVVVIKNQLNLEAYVMPSSRQ
jgi:hypothetical protein